MASGISSHISCTPPIVGIFAIQGAVLEHADCIRKCGGTVKEVLSPLSVTCCRIKLQLTNRIAFCNSQIRLPKDFEGLHGIILPGGVC